MTDTKCSPLMSELPEKRKKGMNQVRYISARFCAFAQLKALFKRQA